MATARTVTTTESCGSVHKTAVHRQSEGETHILEDLAHADIACRVPERRQEGATCTAAAHSRSALSHAVHRERERRFRRGRRRVSARCETHETWQRYL